MVRIRAPTATPLTPDVVRALGKAITTIKEGRHDAHTAHARVKGMYAWSDVAERTMEVYDTVLSAPHRDTYERLARYVFILLLASLAPCVQLVSLPRSLSASRLR